MTTIVLYSKYSNECKKFFNVMKGSPADFSFIKYLCIDNKKVRNRIIESKNIEITIVPTTLILNDDGTVEKFDGRNCFDWLMSVIEKLSPPPPSQQPPPPQQPEYSQPSSTPLETLPSPQTTHIDDRKTVHFKKPEPKKEVPIQKGGMLTSIDDLDDNVEEEEEEPVKQKISKSDNLLKMAQDMQKERETTVPESKPK